MKRQMYIYFWIFCIVILLFKTVQAEIPIWQIGDFDLSFSGFAIVDTDTIEYKVPQNWESILGQTDPHWGEFPAFLYPSGDHENVPRELRIDFDYLHDYINPTLRIRVKTAPADPNIQVDPNIQKDPNIEYFIDLFKGDMCIGSHSIEYMQFNQYNYYDFSLGYIRKGSHYRNKFTIKAKGLIDISIAFDALYLYLENMDRDGDGVSDADEGDFYKDQNTIVSLRLKNYDPSIIRRILLHIEKSEGEKPYFREAGFLEPNGLNLPGWLGTDRFLPYGCLGFRIEDIGTQDRINLQISLIDQESILLYPYTRFHVYQDSNNWQEIDFELLDGNMAVISLNDGGVGDYDGEKNGIIHTILTLSYSKGFDIHIERGDCFINAVQRRRDYGTDF